MKQRTKRIIWGGIKGTLLGGFGGGTVLGAVMAARKHDQESDKRRWVPDEEIDNALRGER